eukprot:scaffold1953_cov176-Amphora_coffeaeformis.AAC.33
MMKRGKEKEEEPLRGGKIRLLLEAVDGLVPYLTPHLLRSCFPAEETDDRLWIGMAVKDTCCVPVFAADADQSTSNPRGYEFTSDPVVDSWMKEYTRVTVPTFDMVKDANGRQHAKDASVVATDQHVMLWTGNGRQPLTSEQYKKSALGLASLYTVPLYDGGHAVPFAKKKRKLAALRRTQEWSREMNESNTLFPILVDDETIKAGLDEQLQLVEEHKKTDKHGSTGFVLIGWSYLSQSLQQSSLKQVKRRISPNEPLGVLSTKSFSQILTAACHGVTLIGSNLPQQWALEKRAFLCDLHRLVTNNEASEPASKKPKMPDSQSSIQEQLDGNQCLDLHPPCDHMEDHPWYRDKRPLMPDCTCQTCQIHSRAYLYHLVCAKEMLAEVLLFVHNLHHLLVVFRGIEQAQADPEKRASVLAYLDSITGPE